MLRLKKRLVDQIEGHAKNSIVFRDGQKMCSLAFYKCNVAQFSEIYLQWTSRKTASDLLRYSLLLSSSCLNMLAPINHLFVFKGIKNKVCTSACPHKNACVSNICAC